MKTVFVVQSASFDASRFDSVFESRDDAVARVKTLWNENNMSSFGSRSYDREEDEWNAEGHRTTFFGRIRRGDFVAYFSVTEVPFYS